MSLSRKIARPMLASAFVVGASSAVRNSEHLVQPTKPVTDKLVPLLRKAVPQLPEDEETLVKVNAGIQVLAAAGLATGRLPRVSAAVLAASLAPTTLAGHRYWQAGDEATKQQQRIHFFKNVSLLGGLIIAAGDTDGQPGVAWRTRRAAKDARREASHLATSAKHEARLLRAKAPVG